MSTHRRSVDWTHYHIWTDALHARYLAREATNPWNLGTYVRWAVISAWTAFELACREALGVEMGRRAKERIDKEIARRGLPALRWGEGLWQQVGVVQDRRVEFVHRDVPQTRLFPGIPEADHAIDTLREAVRDLHQRLGSASPAWIEDRENVELPGVSAFGHATLQGLDTGVDPAGADTVRVGMIDYQGTERITFILRPGTDPEPKMEELLRATRIPLRAVVAYTGKVRTHEWPVKMRGS